MVDASGQVPATPILQDFFSVSGAFSLAAVATAVPYAASIIVVVVIEHEITVNLLQRNPHPP
jgi:hypothetical protein